MQVALFGGSFDPPHIGHVLGVALALATGDFDRVLVVPVFAHAFDKELLAFEHRVAMTRLAMIPLSRVEVSTVERDLGAPSRTLKTIEHLLAAEPDARLRLVVGADVLLESEKWHAFDEVTRLAPLFVLGRAGVHHADAPPGVLPEVSSTRVRQLLRACAGNRAENPELTQLVPRSVLRYIDEHGLYR